MAVHDQYRDLYVSMFTSILISGGLFLNDLEDYKNLYSESDVGDPVFIDE